MRVLFLGGGRRISLARRFKMEGFSIFSYETEANSPIKDYSTLINGFKWNDPRCNENIINTIIKNNIQLVIPLQDAATRSINEIREQEDLGDIFPVPDKFASGLCLNKKKLEDYAAFQSYYPSPNPNFGIIIKPIEGANSKGIKKITYEEYKKIKNEDNFKNTYIAQRCIDGDEYSVDAYFNKKGKMIDCVPRKRLEVQGGEVNRSITVNPELFGLTSLTRKIGEKIGMRGPACFQYIINNNTVPYLMEINARFGGGVILSLEAGCHMIKWLKNEYILGYPVDESNKTPWKIGNGMIRYFQESFYNKD